MKRRLSQAIAIASFLGSPFAEAVTLVHSNDVMGEIVPCGCRNNPQGGMLRKANLLKKLEDKSLLQLDAGDLLFETDTIPSLLAPQAEVQAGYVLKALDQLNHDAIVPGEKDFSLGLEIFEKLRKNSRAKFVAANLFRQDDSRLLEASEVFTRKTSEGKNLKIGVIGLVGESLSWPPELKAAPALSAAREEVKKLRGKVDLLIALTHQGHEKDTELAKEVPGIDIIVGGHSQAFFQTPLRVEKTLILQSSFRNQYVGLLPLGLPTELPALAERYNLVGLDGGYEQPHPMEKLVAEFKQAVAERSSAARTETFGNGHAAQSASFQTFPRCAECHLKQFDFWRKTPHSKAFASLLEKKQNKNLDCLRCHTVGLSVGSEELKGFHNPSLIAEAVSAGGGSTPAKPLTHEELNQWISSMRSAKSLSSKVKVRPKDPKSLPIKESLSLVSRSWTPVQCENCHGAGDQHPFTGNSLKKTVDSQLCLKCHTLDRAPSWYNGSGKPDQAIIQAKRAQVSCPRGELTQEAR